MTVLFADDFEAASLGSGWSVVAQSGNGSGGTATGAVGLVSSPVNSGHQAATLYGPSVTLSRAQDWPATNVIGITAAVNVGALPYDSTYGYTTTALTPLMLYAGNQPFRLAQVGVTATATGGGSSYTLSWQLVAGYGGRNYVTALSTPTVNGAGFAVLSLVYDASAHTLSVYNSASGSYVLLGQTTIPASVSVPAPDHVGADNQSGTVANFFGTQQVWGVTLDSIVVQDRSPLPQTLPQQLAPTLTLAAALSAPRIVAAALSAMLTFLRTLTPARAYAKALGATLQGTATVLSPRLFSRSVGPTLQVTPALGHVRGWVGSFSQATTAAGTLATHRYRTLLFQQPTTAALSRQGAYGRSVAPRLQLAGVVTPARQYFVTLSRNLVGTASAAWGRAALVGMSSTLALSTTLLHPSTRLLTLTARALTLGPQVAVSRLLAIAERLTVAGVIPPAPLLPLIRKRLTVHQLFRRACVRGAQVHD